jgi:hypothetical protein
MSANDPKPSSEAAPEVSPKRITNMAWGFTQPLILEAAVRTKVYDALDAGPKTLGELATATGASLRGLRAISNALVGLNLPRREGDRYSLTEESAAFLVSTKRSYQGGLFRHISRQLVPAWLPLEQIVRAGKPERAVNQEEAGAEFFAEFVEDILPMSYAAAQALADALAEELHPPAGADHVRVLDIASGSGV